MAHTMSAIGRLERSVSRDNSQEGAEKDVSIAIQRLVSYWDLPEHAAALQQSFPGVCSSSPAWVENLLRRSIDLVSAISTTSVQAMQSEDSFNNCSRSAVRFAELNIAQTLGRLIVWLQQHPEATLGLLQSSSSEFKDEDDDSDCTNSEEEEEANVAAQVDAAVSGTDSNKHNSSTAPDQHALQDTTQQLQIPQPAPNTDVAEAPAAGTGVEGQQAAGTASTMSRHGSMSIATAASAADDGDENEDEDEQEMPLSVQLWYLCHRQLASLLYQAFMGMGPAGDAAVTGITRQLAEAGWLDPEASSPSTPVAALAWILERRPLHWRDLCTVVLAPANTVLHMWAGHRRQDVPQRIAALALPLLRNAQRCIDVVFGAIDAELTWQKRSWWRRYVQRKRKEQQQQQHSGGSTTGGSLTTNLGASSAPAQQQQQQHTNGSSSSSSSGSEVLREDATDAEITAIWRKECRFRPLRVPSLEERRLLCHAMQCQEHILETGVSPSGSFPASTRAHLKLLTSSSEFAAAALQLLAPCCSAYFNTEQQKKVEQQRAAAAAGSTATTTTTSSSSSSSNRDVQINKKHLLPCEVDIPRQLNQMPHIKDLEWGLKDLIAMQHPVYGVCEVADMQCVAQMALIEHLDYRGQQLLGKCPVTHHRQQQQQGSIAAQQQQQQQTLDILESSPALSSLALQLVIQGTLLTAIQAEHEQQDGLRTRKTKWSGHQRGPGVIAYRRVLRQCMQLWEVQSKCAGAVAKSAVVAKAGKQLLALYAMQAHGSVWTDFGDGSRTESTGGAVLNDLWCFGWDRGTQHWQQQQQQGSNLSFEQQENEDRSEYFEGGDTVLSQQQQQPADMLRHHAHPQPQQQEQRQQQQHSVADTGVDLACLSQQREVLSRQLLHQAASGGYDAFEVDNLGLLTERSLVGETASIAADTPQPLLLALARCDPVSYFGIVDNSIRKELDSGKLPQAAQLIRQGLWGFTAPDQNPNTLLQDHAAVAAVASAVAGFVKAWVQGYKRHHSGSSSSSISVAGGNSSSSNKAAADFDFCVAVTNRNMRLGLLALVEWLLTANSSSSSTQQESQQQQQQQLVTNTPPSDSSSSSSVTARQEIASSLFLLLVVTRAGLLMVDTMQSVAQNHKVDAAAPSQTADDGRNAAILSVETADCADPAAVCKYTADAVNDISKGCVQLLACLLMKEAAAGRHPATAAAAATDPLGAVAGGGGAGSSSCSSRPGNEPGVAWSSLLQLLHWHARQQLTAPSSSSGGAGDGGPLPLPFAAAAVAVAAENGTAAFDYCKQLVASLPLPELCGNLACSNLGQISEAAAAKKRCSGCRIARYCSVECQKAHWQVSSCPWQQHKPACQQVKAARAAGAV